MYNTTLAASAIKAGYLIVGTSTGYTHLAGGLSFEVDMPILYPGSAIASVSTGNHNYIAYPSINLRNIMGSSWSGTSRSTAYIAGKLSGTTFKTNDTNFIVNKECYRSHL